MNYSFGVSNYIKSVLQHTENHCTKHNRNSDVKTTPQLKCNCKHCKSHFKVSVNFSQKKKKRLH